MEEKHFCQCGKEAIHQLKNGRWCCSKSSNSCELNKKYKTYSIFDNKSNFLCDYNCGRIAKFISRTGKRCCSKSWATCKKKGKKYIEIYGELQRENLLKGQKSQIGSKRSDEFKKIRSELTRSKWKDPNDIRNSKEYRKRCSKRNKENWKDPTNVFNSKSYRLKRSESLKKEWSKENSIFRTKEVQNKKSIALKEIWKDPNSKFRSKEYKENRTKKSIELWKDPIYIKKVQDASHIRPNKPETFLINLFKDLNLNYEYTGDMSFIIGGKNPDFTNKEKMKVIDFFGSWYHSEEIRKQSREDHEKSRIEHFEKEGYKCLIIWEEELKEVEKVIKKVIQFSKN